MYSERGNGAGGTGTGSGSGPSGGVDSGGGSGAVRSRGARRDLSENVNRDAMMSGDMNLFHPESCIKPEDYLGQTVCSHLAEG